METGTLEIALVVSEDRLAVTLECDAAGFGIDSVVEKIQTQLKALKIATSVERDALEKQLAMGGRVIVARGVPPVPAQDSRLEWARDFFDTGFMVDPATGRIDFRRRSGEPSVQAGELLARLLPAREGKAGTDVFGKRIPVGRPSQLRVHLGPNVRDEKADGAHSYYAAAAGRVRWASEILAVDDVLAISGDVGLETGHIRHHGAVVVKGDVLAGSRIEAGGDVEIQGSVEPSDIQTGGNLRVDQGITGAKGRRIVAGGGIRARYLREAEVQAGDDILVESEIIHSNLKTSGRILMPNGRLIGGEAAAERGMDVGEAGNAMCAPTRLVIGDTSRAAREKEPDPPEKARLDEIHKELEAFNVQQNLSAADREKMTELQFEAWELEKAVESARQEAEQLPPPPSRPAARIVVRGKLFPEAKICCGASKVTISEEMPGPLYATFLNEQLHLHKLDGSETSILGDFQKK
ncbi:MAG: FapA family protein [Candidatus Sumerlaeia bacterium]